MDTVALTVLAALTATGEPDCSVEPLVAENEAVAFVAGDGNVIAWTMTVNDLGEWSLWWRNQDGRYCFVDGGDTLVGSTAVGPLEEYPDEN